jgi:hypothetical protein
LSVDLLLRSRKPTCIVAQVANTDCVVVIVEESDTVTPNEVDVEQIDAFSVVQSLSGGSEEKVGILSGPTLSG